MKILVVTQIIDEKDPVLGFFCEWVRAFSEKCEHITVVCLKKGEYYLPANVDVISLGKEIKPASSFRYLIRLKMISWKLRREYDAVFCHMNPEYILAGALLWKMLGKKISFWYAHSTVSFRLRVAVFLSDIVLTSTNEGLKVKTKKKKVIGQGIDTEIFSPAPKDSSGNILHMVTVGRISPSKDYDTIVDACAALSKEKIDYRLDIIGAPGTKGQESYLALLEKKVEDLKLSEKIYFLGPKSQRDIIPYLQNADIFVSAGLTGSLDKALLEAMSCGTLTISCNTSFKNLSAETARFSFTPKDSNALSEKIKEVVSMPYDARLKVGQKMRNMVEKDHGLSDFARKIMDAIAEIK